MKTQLTTLDNGTKRCAVTDPCASRKPRLALLRRVLWAAGLVLPAFGTPAGVVFTNLYSFTGTNDGISPQAGLVQGSDGNFYGTTANGGTNGGNGTVFKISANGALTNLYSFGGPDGANPYAGLVQASDGYLYGTTANGGTNASGSVFKISTDGVLTNLYSFTGGDDGATPLAGLAQGSDGYLYGTTAGYVGSSSNGTVFRISTNGALSNLYIFTGTNDGANPTTGLVQGNDGYFYGTTSAGGTNGGHGTVFKISTNGALTNLYSFTGANDGGNPEGALVQGSDGNFYGTTANGGTNTHGTVFNISTNGVLSNLYSFTGGINGANPFAGLVQGGDGSFYGTTYNGGSSSSGTVFKISTNGAFSGAYSFSRVSDGAAPLAGLVQGSDGSFYGTTSQGGTIDIGTVFRLTIEPQLTLSVSGGFVTLSWPTNYPGWYLQKTVDLGAAGFVSVNLPFPPHHRQRAIRRDASHHQRPTGFLPPEFTVIETKTRFKALNNGGRTCAVTDAPRWQEAGFCSADARPI